MQRVPPDVCLDDNDGGEPPHWSTKLDGDYMGFQLVAGFKRGKPVLRQNARGGTDLLVQCQPRQLAYTKSFDDVTNSMRGLRSVLRGSPVYRDGGGYSLLNERGELAHADSPEAVYFYASLAPGFYVIEREPADNSYRLFWKDDRGTKQTALPTLEPEVLSRYNRDGIPLRVKRKKLPTMPPTPRKRIKLRAPVVDLPPYQSPLERLRQTMIAKQIERESVPRRKRLVVPTVSRKRLPT